MEKFIKYFLIILFSFNNISAQINDESWKIYNDETIASIKIYATPEVLEYLYSNVESDSLHIATVIYQNSYINETIDSVGLRLRGNTSRTALKKSFKLDFNEFIKGRKFYNVEKLNLNGEHNDPSIIRSKISWDFFHKIGVVASRATYSEVYINDVYYGLYISVEHIDDEFLEKNFTDNSGNLWKCTWPADLKYRGSNPQDYHPWVGDERPYELKTNTEEYDFSQLARLITIINQTPDEYFQDSLESVIDVKEILQYFAANKLLGSWDDYWFLRNNFYLYHNPSENKFHIIPYDYDNSFGIDFDFGYDWANINPYSYATIDSDGRPLVERIFQFDDYRNLYTHFMKFYNLEVFNLSNWGYQIDSLKNLITDSAERDSFKTLDYGFTNEDFHNSYSATHWEKFPAKRGLKEYVSIRSTTLQQQFTWRITNPIVYDIDWYPKNPTENDTLTIVASIFGYYTLSDVKLTYQTDDLTEVISKDFAFQPILSKKVEENDRWIVKIAPNEFSSSIAFQIFVNDINQNNAIFPRGELIKVTRTSFSNSGIFINEILAKNTDTNSDENGEYSDWLEIFNSNNYSVDLSSFFLSDNAEELTEWQFPAETEIPAKDFLLIWCDDDNDPNNLHANFKLTTDGETVFLVNSDGETIEDSVTFPIQEANISFARLADGGSSWGYHTPTPNSTNVETIIENQNLPIKFELYQNYPNPFNPSTEIKFSLQQNSHVKLEIFNILGQKVAKLIDKEMTAGSHNYQLTIDNYQLSSGVYFYQMQTSSGFTDIKKMILMK